MKSVTKAIVGLHNCLMERKHEGDNQYCPPNYIDKKENDHVLPRDWRYEQNHISGPKDVRSIGSNNYSKTVKVIRGKLKTILQMRVQWTGNGTL